MNEKHNPSDERRHFLKLLGGGAILIPLAGLTACGKEPQPEAAGTTSTPPERAADPAPPTAPSPPPAPTVTPPAGGDDLPRVSLDDPQAKALGYVHDATTVDAAAQPRYQPGQICKNCALYTGGDEPWGGCSIFPGKAVNANGWCSAYVPRPT